MSKKKIKTSKAAKLSGLLTGLGAWALLFLISLLIGVFFAQVLGIGILENDIFLIVFMVLWLLLGPIVAIIFGRFVSLRWEGYPNNKKYLLNIISSLLVLPSLFFVTHHGGVGKKHVEWYDNGKKKKELVFKNGKINGIAVGWDENGNKRFEENYKDGKKDGLQVHWYENGQKMEAINAKDGKKDGLETQWHENGKKKLEANFINDKLMNFINWNEDGKKIKEGRWIEDLKLFLGNEWYENGMKKIESEWDGENTLTVRRYNNKGETIRATIDTKAKSRVKAE